MPRTSRASAGGYCYHVLNRGNARAEVFHKDQDFPHGSSKTTSAPFRLPGHPKDEAGWLGVKWLSGPRSTQEAVVRPSRACRSPRCTDVQIVLDRESARLPPVPRCERSCSEGSQC